MRLQAARRTALASTGVLKKVEHKATRCLGWRVIG
jgi:hypothetical protein